MAANVVTVNRAYSGTQAAQGTVDVVTFSIAGDTLIIDNRSASCNIYFTWAGRPGAGSTPAPATPAVAGNDCFYVPAGAFRSFTLGSIGAVALIGDAASMTYTLAVC